MTNSIKYVCLMMTLFACCSIVVAQDDQETDLPESVSGSISFQTIHTDGEKILQVMKTPNPDGELVIQTYTVTIPYTEVVDGAAVTRFRQETRTRTVVKTTPELKPVGEKYTFQELNGNDLKPEEVVRKIPMVGRLVVVVHGDHKLPPGFEELLKKDTIIMRIPIPGGESGRPAIRVLPAPRPPRR